jgi:predicted nucleotidyltransferase
LLALLYLHPDAEYSLSEAATIIRASVKAVHTEASRLVESGFATDRRIGNVRLVRASQGSIITRPLTDLLAVTYGPLPVLTELLTSVDGIECAFIYGSWAARYLGEPGLVPNDIDVLVVGHADRDELNAVAEHAEHTLMRPVSIRRVRSQAWHSAKPTDSFLATVRDRPLVSLQIGDSEDAQP